MDAQTSRFHGNPGALRVATAGHREREPIQGPAAAAPTSGSCHDTCYPNDGAPAIDNIAAISEDGARDTGAHSEARASTCTVRDLLIASYEVTASSEHARLSATHSQGAPSN